MHFSGMSATTTDKKHVTLVLCSRKTAARCAQWLQQEWKYPQQACFTLLLTAREVSLQSGFHTCWMKTSMPHVCCWPTAHFHHWRREGEVFLSLILTVDDSWMNSYDSEMKCPHAEWHSSMSPQRKLHRRIKVLWKWCISCWRPWWTSVAWCSPPLNFSNGAYIYDPILCNNVWHTLCTKQLLLLQCGLLLLHQNKVIPHPVQLCCRTSWDILAHPPYLSVVAL